MRTTKEVKAGIPPAVPFVLTHENSTVKIFRVNSPKSRADLQSSRHTAGAARQSVSAGLARLQRFGPQFLSEFLDVGEFHEGVVPAAAGGRDGMEFYGGSHRPPLQGGRIGASRQRYNSQFTSS
jgi:hypothetical protein